MHYSLHFRYVHPARRTGVVATEDELFPESTLVHRARPHSHHARLLSCGPSGCILVLNMGLLLEMRNLLGLLILHTLMRDFLCFDGTSAYDSTDDAGPVSMSKTAR